MLLPVLAAVSMTAGADSLSVPALVGKDVYHAHRALRRLGLVSRFEQVEVDTSRVPLFVVASQEPESDAMAKAGDTIVLRFNHPGMLQYWNPSVIPLLGDFEDAVSFYKVQKPPQPIVVRPAAYPAELKKYSFSGIAYVEALVDFDGAVLAARIAGTSGYQAADSAACATALRASFSPAENYGRQVRVWFPMPYHFRFKEDDALPVPEPPRDASEPP